MKEMSKKWYKKPSQVKYLVFRYKGEFEKF